MCTAIKSFLVQALHCPGNLQIRCIEVHGESAVPGATSVFFE